MKNVLVAVVLCALQSNSAVAQSKDPGWRTITPELSSRCDELAFDAAVAGMVATMSSGKRQTEWFATQRKLLADWRAGNCDNLKQASSTKTVPKK